MKLKEAQMLGILALVAVVVVLLCMWGGDDVPDEGALIEADDQSLAFDEQQPGVNELLDELTADQQQAPGATTPELPETSVVLGGTPPAQSTEDLAIRNLIDERAPADIPLVAPTSVSPAAATQSPALQPADLKPVYHVVQKGDTLSGISKRYYGTTSKHALIQKANAALVRDSKSLQIGMKLQIPPLEGGTARNVAVVPSATTPVLSATASTRTYTVQKGDSFWRIAQKCYQDGTKCKDIQAANKATVPDASKLQPGMVLVIP